MDGLCNWRSDGMDGNGRSGHPFHCVDEMDGGRGMDRHAVGDACCDQQFSHLAVAGHLRAIILVNAV